MDDKEKYEEEVKNKSVKDLKDILLDIDFNNGWLITAARKELENRGVELNKEESEQIELNKKSKINLAVKNNNINGFNTYSLFSQKWKFNIVENIDAPELYSRKAIYFFTIFCSVFFGGTLMFINLKRLKNKKGQIVVAFYTIFYSAISFSILSQFEQSTFLTFTASIIGSYPLINYFWIKYVGHKTEYRKKSIVKPLIIALSIMLIIILLSIITYMFGGNLKDI